MSAARKRVDRPGPKVAHELNRARALLALEWAIPAALMHATADHRCGRAWVCACGPCLAARKDRFVEVFVLSRCED